MLNMAVLDILHQMHVSVMIYVNSIITVVMIMKKYVVEKMEEEVKYAMMESIMMMIHILIVMILIVRVTPHVQAKYVMMGLITMVILI